MSYLVKNKFKKTGQNLIVNGHTIYHGGPPQECSGTATIVFEVANGAPWVNPFYVNHNEEDTVTCTPVDNCSVTDDKPTHFQITVTNTTTKTSCTFTVTLQDAIGTEPGNVEVGPDPQIPVT
jgi:hypothetical protein